MTTRTPDRSRTARVVEITVGDSPDSWAAAGFIVVDGKIRIGDTTFRLTGSDATRGITGWTIAGVVDPGTGTLDGIPTQFVDVAQDSRVQTSTLEARPAAPPHPNGTVGLDHVVITTPDLDRTIDAFRDLQLPHRRIRDVGNGADALRQAFIRIGTLIVEVVGPAVGSGESAEVAPAGWFGIAIDVDDLDVTAAFLGDGIGRIKPAVQTGRRIGTVRHRSFDISTAIAAMDHRAAQAPG
ncbi:MAG: hypothetical protein KDB02_04470 [Acidimicrobiales bacterium]|nr:hypothetical protein [Acidimicrobiales bacterium]